MAAWDYCGKPESRCLGPVEHGIPPAAKNSRGDTKKRNEMILCYGLARAIDEGFVPLEKAAQTQKGINLYHGLKVDCKSNPVLQNEWHYGATGLGKSRPLREAHPDAYIKDANMWWDHYQGEKVVIIEDLGPKMIGAQKLKVWGDHYPFAAEGKGYCMKIRPEKILITSNWSIKECYPEPQDYEAL